MSWLYSQALVEEYLGENCLDGEQSVPLSGSNTQQAYCAPDKMMGFSRLSQFGMTYKPLTENRGEELLTLYLEDFHAKTLVPQEKVQELMESEAECGNIWQESSEKSSQSLLSLKTPLCYALEDSMLSYKTLPKWGMMLDGECYQQQAWVLTTRETESGLSQKMWLTPRVLEIDETPENFRKRMNGKRKNDRKNGFGNLTMQVKAMLPTSTCHNSKEGAYPAEYNRKTPSLATHAGGKLNPMWVEWLMGWPLGWTDLKPLETDKSHSAPPQLGDC